MRKARAGAASTAGARMGSASNWYGPGSMPANSKPSRITMRAARSRWWTGFPSDSLPNASTER